MCFIVSLSVSQPEPALISVFSQITKYNLQKTNCKLDNKNQVQQSTAGQYCLESSIYYNSEFAREGQQTINNLAMDGGFIKVLFLKILQ